MSISSTPMMPSLTPMKKKIIAVIAAVIIGHTGVMWALKNMKTPELRPVEKEPLKVRFVKIQEPPKPLPPKPKAEPKKEKPKPKEVKIVEKPLPAPPKKVEKVQQVKKAETPKPVVKPVETPVQTPVVTTSVSVTKTPKVVIPAPVTPPAPPSPPAPPAPPSPKIVSVGGSGVQWSRSPKPTYANSDLQGQSRTVVILIEANEKGSITSARVTRSSGVASLDEKILRAVRNAKFKPYKENGIAYPIKAEQPFDLSLSK